MSAFQNPDGHYTQNNVCSYFVLVKTWHLILREEHQLLVLKTKWSRKFSDLKKKMNKQEMSRTTYQ